MIEIASKKIGIKEKNEIILKTIELDSGLDCFILIDTKDQKFGEIILNKLLDNIIGKISFGSAYRDLSIALENTNSIIKNWKDNEGIDGKLNIFVGILEDSDLIFSTIGTPSCYLIKKDLEIVEVTEKDDTPSNFSFISNGEIKNEEHIIICSDKLLHHVSRSDIVDSLEVENVDDVASNLEITLLQEKLKRNLGFIVIKNSYFKNSKDSSISGVKNAFYKLGDNLLIKKIIAFYLLIKDKMSGQSKSIKTIFFLLGIIVCFTILFIVLQGILQSRNIVEFKEKMQQVYADAQTYVDNAKTSLNNPEAFRKNIEKAETNIKELTDNNIFENEREELNLEIAALKRQFNGIETFDENASRYYTGLPSETKKIFNIGGQIYAITKDSVIGPISEGGDGGAKEFKFNDIGEGEFDDMFSLNNSLLLTTTNGRIVHFDKSGSFKFYNVSGQDKWEDFTFVDTYANTYLYTLSKNGDQIYKHRLFGSTFEKGSEYLKHGDGIDEANNIIDIGIDGGIYVLQKQGENSLDISKVLNMNSGYKVVDLTLGRFPDPFSIEEGTSAPRIIAGSDLKYVYLILNNRFRVLQTDSNEFNTTKSLVYIGQIDGVEKIKDFAIARDGELFILNNKGIYRIGFEISDNKLILK